MLTTELTRYPQLPLLQTKHGGSRSLNLTWVGIFPFLFLPPICPRACALHDIPSSSCYYIFVHTELFAILPPLPRSSGRIQAGLSQSHRHPYLIGKPPKNDIIGRRDGRYISRKFVFSSPSYHRRLQYSFVTSSLAYYPFTFTTSSVFVAQIAYWAPFCPPLPSLIIV